MEDCFFYIDCRTPKDEQYMSVMCVQCHDEKHPDMGWFWPGTKKGYGPFEYKCAICGKMVHQGLPEVVPEEG